MGGIVTDPRLTEADRLMRQADGFDQRAEQLRDEAMELRQAARRIRRRVSRESIPRDPRIPTRAGDDPYNDVRDRQWDPRSRNILDDPSFETGEDADLWRGPHTISATAATIAIPPCDGVAGALDALNGVRAEFDLDPLTDTAESVQADAERPSAGRNPRDARVPSGERPPVSQWDQCPCGARWNPETRQWTDGLPERVHVREHGYGCQCWNEGQYGRVHREDCPLHREGS